MTREAGHGADEVLKGVFLDLGQIGEAGDPKYSEAVLRRLAAKILDGRAHELLVFRLCHLVRCASIASEVAGGRYGWLEFFCASRAGRANWAANWLRARLSPIEDGSLAPASAAVDRVMLRYEGRSAPVTISYGAMPLLVAFMEFLLNTLQYDEVRDWVAPLSRRDLSWRELQDTSNALSRAVYGWLRQHTRPVQESRDFEEVARFLSERGARGDFTAGDIDDAAILQFWRAASIRPGSGFVTFRKTFRTFLRFAAALQEEILRAGLERPEALGRGPGMDGHDPADPASPGLDRMRAPSAPLHMWESGEDEDDGPSPLEEVAGSEIKLLLAEEARRLALIDAHWRDLPGLAHSLLRDAVFGHAQGRLSQALRTNAADIEALVRQPPAADFDDEVASLENLLNHLEELIAVAAFVLIGGKGEGATEHELDFGTLNRGRQALRNIRRKGFDGVRAGTPAAVKDLRAAVPGIVVLRDRLSPLCAKLRQGNPWAVRQGEDERVFRAQFSVIYGVAEPEGKEVPS